MASEFAPTTPATDEVIAWPNLTRAAAMFKTSVASMSRWADQAEATTRVAAGRVLRPRELLRIAEQRGRSLYTTAEQLYDFVDEATEDEEIRAGVITEVNEYLADYQRRRDPARTITMAEALETLRRSFPHAAFERIRARLEGPELPGRADMFSAEPGQRAARPRRRRAPAGSGGARRRASPSVAARA